MEESRKKNDVCSWENGKTCFAYEAMNGKCRALMDTEFPNRNSCSFYKSREQYDKELKNVLEQ